MEMLSRRKKRGRKVLLEDDHDHFIGSGGPKCVTHACGSGRECTLLSSRLSR